MNPVSPFHMGDSLFVFWSFFEGKLPNAYCRFEALGDEKKYGFPERLYEGLQRKVSRGDGSKHIYTPTFLIDLNSNKFSPYKMGPLEPSGFIGDMCSIA